MYKSMVLYVAFSYMYFFGVWQSNTDNRDENRSFSKAGGFERYREDILLVSLSDIVGKKYTKQLA